MNRRLLVILGSVAVIFVIAVVGASTINLTGSDNAPGEGKTVANCVDNLVVKTPVDTSIHDANSVKVMTITGDMSNCVGETLRAEVNLGTANHAWAIRKITTAVQSLTLTFDATTGDFYDTKPTVTGGDLVVAGTRLAPVLVKDIGISTITIAKTWQ
jgi:hypothetical protein